MSKPFVEGQIAKREGKTYSDNPYITGFTKLGAPKLSDDGIEWLSGFGSVGRTADKAEVAAAETVNIHNFGRRYRRRD